MLLSNKPILKPLVAAMGFSVALLSITVQAQTTSAQSSQQAQPQLVAVQSVKVAQDNPYMMIEQAATKMFARIKLEQDKIQEDPDNLRLIMEEELIPYIGYKFSAFKVLGKYARQVKKKELLEFVSVFREYLITSYAVAMGYYNDQIVEFEPPKDFSKRSDVTVRAVIKDPVRPDIKVAFKVRKDPRTGQWQAYDMIAEGISMLSSKQSEFEGMLRKDGIVKVIESMRESIRQPIVLQNDDPEQVNSSKKENETVSSGD